MGDLSVLKLVESIDKFEGGNDYSDWKRQFLDVTTIACPPLAHIVRGVERPQSNTESPDESSVGPINAKEIEAWDSANSLLFSVLRLCTKGAARSVLMRHEPKHNELADGKKSVGCVGHQVP